MVEGECQAWDVRSPGHTEHVTGFAVETPEANRQKDLPLLRLST